MLSIKVMSSGSEDYYLNLAREDYYTKGGEPPGRWLGCGAEKLGLRGVVAAEDLRQLFAGYSPDMVTKLRRNAGIPPRREVVTTEDGLPIFDAEGKPKTKIIKARAGCDLTFSAPKSVSVLWAVTSPEERYAIQEAHYQAVIAAIEYLERFEAECRRGAGGRSRERTALVVAAYEHGTSRAQDPQLHTHALVLNVGVREDGTTGGIENHCLYRAKMAAGAVYRAELAKRLEQELYLEVKKTEKSFEITGVPEMLCDEFSKRSKQIKKSLAERGESGAVSAARAALVTREQKAHTSREVLFEQWRNLGLEFGFYADLVPRQQPHHDLQESLRAIATHANRCLTYQESHFTRRDLFRVAAVEAVGCGVGWKELEKFVPNYLESPSVTSLGHYRYDKVYTSTELLECEETMLSNVAEGVESTHHSVSEETLIEILSRHCTLKDEQIEAIIHITNSPGDVAVVSGMAGTGKTTLLNVARQAWEQEGYRVLGASLAGKAAEGLEAGSGIESDTIARFLLDIGRGKKALDEKSVLVIDESGMVGTRQMAELVSLAKSARAKLVLLGDPGQLQSIEAGGAHKAIAKIIGDVTLSDISRQRDLWQREAVKAFAEGRSLQALTSYIERGYLTVSDTRQGAMEELIAGWEAHGGVVRPKDHLILASTRRETAVLNRLAQTSLHAWGRLSPQGIRHEDGYLYEGDRVIFTKNSKLLGVNNGNFGTIRKIDLHERALYVRLDNSDTTVKCKLSEYNALDLGYVVTTHKAQGVTVENSYILSGGYMQSREQAYVQMSRHRGSCRIYVDRDSAGDGLSEMARQLGRSREKKLAVSIQQELSLPEQEQSLCLV